MQTMEVSIHVTHAGESYTFQCGREVDNVTRQALTATEELLQQAAKNAVKELPTGERLTVAHYAHRAADAMRPLSQMRVLWCRCYSSTNVMVTVPVLAQ